MRRDDPADLNDTPAGGGELSGALARMGGSLPACVCVNPVFMMTRGGIPSPRLIERRMRRIRRGL